jgi:7-cyano-7-deazaguanine synthase
VRDIVQRGVELGAPFQWTWSCYRETEVACGVCDSCALRLRAFQEAGLVDPVRYATRPEYART